MSQCTRVIAAIDRLRRSPRGVALFTGVLSVVDPRTDAAEVYAALKAQRQRLRGALRASLGSVSRPLWVL